MNDDAISIHDLVNIVIVFLLIQLFRVKELLQKFKKVCVALSIWNGDTTENIRECLESLRLQTLKDFEVVIVIDGPVSQEISKLISSYGNTVISKKNNSGLADSLNTIITNTDHEFIARMDADDKCESNRLERQLQFMTENACVDVCGSAVEAFGDSKGYRNYPLTHDDCLKYFKYSDPISHPTAFFRRRFFYC